MQHKELKQSGWLMPLLVFGLLFLIYVMICKRLGVVPFASEGTVSLASNDAFYQYLDFFGWYYDILKGRQSAFYSFSSYLGQNTFGLYSYYLASPFNLLILFFDKTRLHEFFDIVIGLKLSLSGSTMYIFLRKRFRDLNWLWVLMLSLCYGLMHYNFAQSSNIMWLDGVYMLPLILLGTYRLAAEGKGILLSFAVAISVLFNWYSGGINCLMAGIYYLYETSIIILEQENKINCKAVLKNSIHFMFAMLRGLMISAVLFLPTVLVMRQGKGGEFDWNRLFNIAILGNPLSAIKGYSIGEEGAPGNPALFCGCLPLLGCMGLFIRPEEIKKKVPHAGFLALMVMIYFWRPLYMLFSLLKQADSYWYRYSYVTCISMIIVSGHFFKNLKKEGMSDFLKSTAMYIFLAMVLDFASPHADMEDFFASLFVMFSAASFIRLFTVKGIGKVSGVLFSLLLVLELGYSGYKTARSYLYNEPARFNEYNQEQIYLVDSIKEHDNSEYRITQTMTRGMDYQFTTANYNESMAFNYRSIEGYTSSPQNTQLDMLAKLGYVTYSECLLSKNTFLLHVDSLLGVKYLMAPYAVRGVEKISFKKEYNGKLLYRNDYALPFGFRIEEPKDPSFFDAAKPYVNNIEHPWNSFEFVNSLYRELSGDSRSVLEPLEYTEEKGEDQTVYTIQIPNGDYAVYGNIPCASEVDGWMHLNGVLRIPYSKWLAVQAFNVPTDKEQREASVIFEAENQGEIMDVQFYGLNLDTFREITGQLQAKAAEEIMVENGHVKFEVSGKRSEYLFTSIPYDDGWSVFVNGKVCRPELFEDCLMCIPLEDGANQIEMCYTVPGLKAGAFMTLLGIGLLILSMIRNKNRGKKIC